MSGKGFRQGDEIFLRKPQNQKKRELESLERKKLTSRKHSKNIEVVLYVKIKKIVVSMKKGCFDEKGFFL